MGIRVDSVSLHPDKSRGTLDWYSAARTNIRQGENIYGDEGVIILLAGAAAQKKHAPSSMRMHTAVGDFGKADLLVFGHITVGQPVDVLQQKRWNWLGAVTSKLIEANWSVIDAVARRLFTVGEISGDEVKRVFRQFKGVRKRLPLGPHYDRL